MCVPNWDNQKLGEDAHYYYGSAAFCKDKILVSYLGDESFIADQNKEKKSNHPTKFLVFDRDGNYLQTLETGYRIMNFCYDEENNRVIMNLDDVIQFGYLDLNGLME